MSSIEHILNLPLFLISFHKICVCSRIGKLLYISPLRTGIRLRSRRSSIERRRLTFRIG